jgi:hypothetical protein
MMAAATASTSLVPVQPLFTDAERLALAGYLAGYHGLTREAYTLDLRQFTGWCRARALPLFSVRRADIETFARELEARGRARATVTRRLCTIAGFYKYAVEEELLDHSPAAHVRLNERAVVLLLEHDVLKPPGGRLDDAYGSVGEPGAQPGACLPRNNMVPAAPDRGAGQSPERALTVPVPGRRSRRADRDLLAHLDPGAGRRERGLHPGDDLIPGRLARGPGPAELASGDAAGLSAGGHLRTD